MSSLSAKLEVRGWSEFKKALKVADENRRKNGETAVRVEAYRLSSELKKELRKGAPGGTALAPLRVITRGTSSRKPLAKLAAGVRYWYQTIANGKVFSVGFNASGSWTKIAERQQEGYLTPADSAYWYGTLREKFIHQGAKYKDSGKKSLAKYFFLRGSTSSLKTPARPIIAPFWSAHQHEVERNVISNFNRKMRGERI